MIAHRQEGRLGQQGRASGHLVEERLGPVFAVPQLLTSGRGESPVLPEQYVHLGGQPANLAAADVLPYHAAIDAA
jgi:hypothetical protein